jgi:hypothetical protein
VSQVVSQQKQLVLNSSSGVVVPEAPDPSVPSSTASPLLSNDILADSMARSKLLASTAKEMMESMSVKVDMDQETRDLIDQLETITMEEVERGERSGCESGQESGIFGSHFLFTKAVASSSSIYFSLVTQHQCSFDIKTIVQF